MLLLNTPVHMLLKYKPCLYGYVIGHGATIP